MTATDAGTGAGQTDIQNKVNFNFSLSPAITSYEWRIYQVDNIGSLGGAVELFGEETATASEQAVIFNYTQDIKIAVQIIANDADMVESVTYYTLKNAPQEVLINLTRDTNN